jgi:hypothetical protein
VTVAPEGRPTLQLSVSNSEIQTWKRCRRKWYLGHYLEVGPRRDSADTGARALGTKVHIALQRMYEEGANPVDVINELYQEDVNNWPNAIDALQREADLARAMVEGYVQWIEETGADVYLQLVASETKLEVEFPEIPGVKLRGRLDQRVIRSLDGVRLFRDFKTVGDLTTPPKLLPIDEQMKFYHLLEFLDALMKTGEGPPERTGGGLYTMLRKVKRTATAKPPFYETVEVRHNLETLRSMWLRVVAVIREIIAAREALDAGGDHRYFAYPTPDSDCSWKCDHLGICPMMDDGSNWEGMIAEHYEHVDPYARYGDEDLTG